MFGFFLNNIIKAPHCKLYDEGQKRIGCIIMCPMESLKQIQKDIKKFPYVKKKWIEAIKEMRKNGIFDYKYTDNPNTTEDDIAENIFDYWISRKSYNKWYSNKFLQQKINFDYNEKNN